MRICKSCGRKFKNRQFVEGMWRNFQRRKYCLTCSPFRSGNTKKLENGIISPGEKKQKKRTKSVKCLEWQKKARIERKIKLVQAFGGKCPFCNYSKCYKAFDFHHVDPSKKDLSISTLGMLTKWETIITEIKKCILVCSNCHREIHAGLISQEEIEVVYNDGIEEVKGRLNWEMASHIKPSKKNVCVDCEKKIDVRSKRCAKCYSLMRRSIRPPKEKLLKEVVETNYCAVGRKYGVSDNAIRKWLRQYGVL
jgi:hypothetical protein